MQRFVHHHHFRVKGFRFAIYHFFQIRQNPVCLICNGSLIVHVDNLMVVRKHDEGIVYFLLNLLLSIEVDCVLVALSIDGGLVDAKVFKFLEKLLLVMTQQFLEVGEKESAVESVIGEIGLIFHYQQVHFPHEIVEKIFLSCFLSY